MTDATSPEPAPPEPDRPRKDEEIRILFIGIIVGSPGVFCIKNLLPEIKREKGIDFVIANGEGTTGGFGIGKNHSIYLHKLGVDVITSGECIYYKKDMVPHIAKAPYILRPANYPYGNPGRGWAVYTLGERKIAVINALGQSGFSRVHLTNPFLVLPPLIKKIRGQTETIIVDFHAVTTAEKCAMGYHLDGTVSAVLGTHAKALTADQRVLAGGTAYITDAGRTGSSNSVGGLDPSIEIEKFLTQIHQRSKAGWDRLELQGVIITVAPDGRATAIERIRWEHSAETRETGENPQDETADDADGDGDDDGNGAHGNTGE